MLGYVSLRIIRSNLMPSDQVTVMLIYIYIGNCTYSPSIEQSLYLAFGLRDKQHMFLYLSP